MVEALSDIHHRRQDWASRPNDVRDILNDGAGRARLTAPGDHGTGPVCYAHGMSNAEYNIKLDAFEGAVGPSAPPD